MIFVNIIVLVGILAYFLMVLPKPGLSYRVIQLFDIQNSNICYDHSNYFYKVKETAEFKLKKQIERYEAE